VILRIERALAGDQHIGLIIGHRIIHEVRRRFALLLQDGEVAIELISKDFDQRRLRPSAATRDYKETDCTHVLSAYLTLISRTGRRLGSC